MNFLIGGSLILLAILNFPLVNVIVGIEVIIFALFTYLIARTLMGKEDK